MFWAEKCEDVMEEVGMVVDHHVVVDGGDGTVVDVVGIDVFGGAGCCCG